MDVDAVVVAAVDLVAVATCHEEDTAEVMRLVEEVTLHTERVAVASAEAV